MTEKKNNTNTNNGKRTKRIVKKIIVATIVILILLLCCKRCSCGSNDQPSDGEVALEPKPLELPEVEPEEEPEQTEEPEENVLTPEDLTIEEPAEPEEVEDEDNPIKDLIDKIIGNDEDKENKNGDTPSAGSNNGGNTGNNSNKNTGNGGNTGSGDKKEGTLINCSKDETKLICILARYAGNNVIAGRYISREDVVVKAYYSDGKSKTVTNFTVESKKIVLGNNTIKVTYTENGVTKTATIVVIGIKKLSAIVAKYTGGDVPSGSYVSRCNVTVTAYYMGGPSKLVTNFSLECKKIVVGENTIKVTYTEDGVTKETTIKVTGIKMLSYISVKYTGGNVVAGQYLSKNNIAVTAYYSDGSNKTVTNFTVESKKIVLGNNTIKVTYTENGVTKTATIVVVGISGGSSSGSSSSGGSSGGSSSGGSSSGGNSGGSTTPPEEEDEPGVPGDGDGNGGNGQGSNPTPGEEEDEPGVPGDGNGNGGNQGSNPTPGEGGDVPGTPGDGGNGSGGNGQGSNPTA